MRRLLPLMWAVGCGGPLPDWAEQDSWVWLELDVQTVPAFDPKLQGQDGLPITIATQGYVPDGCTIDVTARTVAGLVLPVGQAAAPVGLQQVSMVWDGMDAQGFAVDPGSVQFLADLWCGSQVQGVGEAWTHVVRLAPGEVDVHDTEARVPLAWHKASLTERRVVVAPDGLAEWRRGETVDDPAGHALAEVPVWSHAAVAPWGSGDPGEARVANVPVAAIGGSTLALSMTPGARTISQSGGVPGDVRGPAETWETLPIVRVVSPQLQPQGESAWQPGTAARFTLTEPLPADIGRHDLPIQWSFEALVDGEWLPIPGHTTTTHRVYTLAGPTMVPDGTANGGAPAASWVGVLEDVLPAVEGVASDDPVSIMHGLRDHLHTDPYITYNPSDTAYSTFAGRYIYWDRIWVEMSDYLDREQGIDLYCHSVACVVSSQANHLGLETEYITIVNEDHPETGARFTTWLTRAAGTMGWRRWTFNSHGITILDDRVWDAAVDVDSDENPGREPTIPLSPKGLTFDEYNDVISANNLVIVNRGRCDNY